MGMVCSHVSLLSSQVVLLLIEYKGSKFILYKYKKSPKAKLDVNMKVHTH